MRRNITTKLPGPRFFIYDEVTRPAFFHLRRSYQARVFRFKTKLRQNDLPGFSVYYKVTRPAFFHLRQSYQARVFPFTTKLRGIDLTIYDVFTTLNPKHRE